MVYENRKKRYEFYLKNNDTVRAKELRAKYPDVAGELPKKEKNKKE